MAITDNAYTRDNKIDVRNIKSEIRKSRTPPAEKSEAICKSTPDLLCNSLKRPAEAAKGRPD